MSQPFAPGDDLIFQLESGFGLLRVLSREGEGDETVWHLKAYEEFFPDIESAEKALTEPDKLHIRKAHMALTDRALEKTPSARLGNRPVSPAELLAYNEWLASKEKTIFDRSALLILGVR